MVLVAPNVTCFLFVSNRVAVRFNAKHTPYDVFLHCCLKPGVDLALFLSCALSMVNLRDKEQ